MTSRALWREDEAIDGVRKTLRHQLHPEQLHKEPKNWKALASPSPWKAHWFLSISSKPSQFPLEGDWNALREVDRNSAGMQPWVLFQLTAYIVYSEPKVRRRLAVWELVLPDTTFGRSICLTSATVGSYFKLSDSLSSLSQSALLIWKQYLSQCSLHGQDPWRKYS